jgi:hypothetical protein
MEKRKGILGMIGGIEQVLHYAGIVGQVPEFHPWLMGNLHVSKFLASQPFFQVPNPL